MDPRAKAGQELVSFLIQQGLIVFGSTAAGGIMMGPAGLAIGSAAGGAAATVFSVVQTPGWRYFATAVTGFLLNVLPQLFSTEYVSNFLRSLARLVVRLLRRGGLLPASELHRTIAYPNRRPDDRDDGPGSVH